MVADQDTRSGNRAAPQGEVADPLADVGRALVEGLDADERLQSGVPKSQRATDLEFVQMTGLTRSVPEPPTRSVRPPDEADEEAVSVFDPDSAPAIPLDDRGDEPSPPEDAAPKPTPLLSFFEEGVADVDAAMAPPSLEESELLRRDVVPEPEPAPVASPEPYVDDLTSVIDGLPLAADAADREIEDKDASAPPEVGVARVEDPDAAPLPMPIREAAPMPDEPEPAPTPPTPLDLAEAERLVRELEEQPREVPGDDYEVDVPEADGPVADQAPVTGNARPPLPRTATERGDSAPTPAPEEEATSERDASVYRLPLRRHTGRSSGHRRNRRWRHAVRWALRCVAVAALLAAAGVGYWYAARPLLATPADTLGEARVLAAAGRYLEASGTCAQFARAHPDLPDRAEAQFLAAHCLQMAPGNSFDATQALRARALDGFRQFVSDNPSHVRVPRAKALIGLLNFGLGRYQDAVEVLQDPSLSLRDPDAALPVLRTLARARWKLGEYDAAVSCYQQAAALAGNYTSDLDYEELGDLFRWRSDRAQDEDERRKFLREAVVQWTNTMRTPTIDPATKNKVKEKRQWALDQLGEKAPEDGERARPALTTKTAAPPAAQPPAPPQAAEASRSPQVDPRLEAEYLAERPKGAGQQPMDLTGSLRLKGEAAVEKADEPRGDPKPGQGQ